MKKLVLLALVYSTFSYYLKVPTKFIHEAYQPYSIVDVNTLTMNSMTRTDFSSPILASSLIRGAAESMKSFNQSQHTTIQYEYGFKSHDAFLEDIRLAAEFGDFGQLSEILYSQVLVLPSRDANIIVTRMLQMIAKPGLWAVCRDVLLLLQNFNRFQPDIQTLSAAMTLCIRFEIIFPIICFKLLF